MADDQENFGGTSLVGEDGEQMDPAIAGISPPSVPSLEGDAAGAAVGAEMDDDSGEAEMDALEEEEDGEADVTASGAE